MPRTPVEVRRSELVAAALRVIAARGIHAASTRAIVAEAGMSLASFHYAFESRDELIDRLIIDVLAREEKAIAPAQPEGKSLVELLTAALRGYAEHLRADPAHEQAMLELTQYALRTRPALAQELYDQYIRIVLSSLTLVTERTGIRWSVPLPTVARLLLVLSDGLTLNWLVTRDDAALDAAVVAAADAVAALAERDPEGSGG
ncbi:helix-turn-helix domain-containing protein [Microbacterium sp. ARD32]|uniref:TetR/AcrR family transcriptional regulator n=1 Tax=Microbacterium sp. ARD32 TaxID=2962577 RepID=UPI002881C0B2|nr:helix-turn-helix domain-containing protein [Microbacterium sp. ARD32]MDT0157859.1 helix-turn-helix domain-containing protein [Microbacterium sp. ARD32]